MAHKVHPKAFRIKDLADWDSRWLDTKKTPRYLEEDFKIRTFLNKKFNKMGIEKVEIERFAGKINIIILSSRPGLIIGRGGGGVEELKKEVEVLTLEEKSFQTSASESKGKREIRIEIREVKNPWLSATLAGQWV